MDTLYPAAPAVDAPPAEPTVYEDLFPIGSIPADTCPLHGAATSPLATQPSATPMVDAAVQSTGLTTVAGAAVRSGTRLFVEKMTGKDGLVRYVVTQR